MAAPEDGDRGDRLRREARQPDHEKPGLEVPHAHIIGCRARRLKTSARRAQHGERVGHLEPWDAEPVQLRGPTACRAVGAPPADRLDRAAA